MYQMQKRNIMSIKKKLSGQNVLQVVSLLLNISHVIHCPIHILISLHNKINTSFPLRVHTLLPYKYSNKCYMHDDVHMMISGKLG